MHKTDDRRWRRDLSPLMIILALSLGAQSSSQSHAELVIDTVAGPLSSRTGGDAEVEETTNDCSKSLSVSALSPPGAQPEITHPSPGSTLSTRRQRFEWRANGIEVEAWRLVVTDIASRQIIFDQTRHADEMSVSARELPENTTMSVVLQYKIVGTWKSTAAYPYHTALFSAPDLPAFPGAEGFGANATGGRGGRVIEVTNLADTGPGSLRRALMTEEPRIVVFRVGGEIVLEKEITLHDEHSDLTIAGQTAPGDGITLRNRYLPGLGEKAPIILARDVENVIIRYIRSRPGPSFNSSSTVRGLSISGKNIVIDHCSFSWSTDEVINIWHDAQDITFQWSIISEGLSMSNHPDTLEGGNGHSRGFLTGENSTNLSLHHNLFAHHETRGPRIKNGRVDVVNNVNYNLEGTPSRLDNNQNRTEAEFNYVGNSIKAGPNSDWRSGLKIRDYSDSKFPIVSAYVAGNLVLLGGEAIRAEDDESLPFIVDEPHRFPHVTTYPTPTSERMVLKDAGASVVRDAVDTRIVGEVRTGEGRIIDHPDDVGGWPVIRSGAPPKDSDHDGMPDDWERAHGLDPLDLEDRNSVAASGYTMIEVYLNSIARSARESNLG